VSPPNTTPRTATPGPAPPPDSAGRARILAVALRSFADRGYDGTTTAAVAREAHVTQPLVHHHFGSKEGLWRAAMDTLFSELRMFTALDRTLPPTRALLKVVEGFVRLSAARPELTRIIAREGATPTPRLKYLVDRYLGPQLREIVATLSAEQAAGAIDPALRPELLLFFVTGAAAHLFDVAALARTALGLDVTAEPTREAFVALVLSILEKGVVLGQLPEVSQQQEGTSR
jgi:TetR/AcrR family transcriptional regulator